MICDKLIEAELIKQPLRGVVFAVDECRGYGYVALRWMYYCLTRLNGLEYIVNMTA
jgi:hypothetical protein